MCEQCSFSDFLYSGGNSYLYMDEEELRDEVERLEIRVHDLEEENRKLEKLLDRALVRLDEMEMPV